VTRGCIDAVEHRADGALEVRGWVFPGASAYVVVDGRHTFPIAHGEPRPDVARALNELAAASSGFTAVVRTDGLAAGRHDVAIVCGPDGERVGASSPVVVDPLRAARVVGAFDETTFLAVQGVETQLVQETWYRGEHCNFNPTKADLREPDAVRRHVAAGWLPAAPFITRTHGITAFGSCFAANLTTHLAARSYNVLTDKSHVNVNGSYVIRYGEGIANTFAARQQFAWALEDARFDEDLWYGSRCELAPYNEDIRRETAAIFARTDVFVLTLGVAEVWYNTQSGDVFWRAVPASRFDGAIHGFRLSSVAENVENLAEIRRMIRAHRPDAAIVLTLSPIPAHATFRPVSCVTANEVSKATLRVAIDETMRAFANDPRLFYFPAYEIVRDGFVDPFLDDNRHVKPHVIAEVMATFERAYCVDA
jgi:GSCFA family